MSVSLADRPSDTTEASLRALCRAIGLPAALLAAGTLASGDTIRVTRRPAADGSGYGLLLVVGGVGGPTSDAYVAVGPEKGFANETTLETGFTVDVTRLSLRRGKGASGVLPFLRFGEQPVPGPARVLVFLEQTPAGAWLVGARTWDDARGGLVLAGRAPLPPGSVAAGIDPTTPRPVISPPRLEIEWAAGREPAGAAGRLRVLHARPDGERVLLFEKTGLDNAAQVVNHVRVGVVAGDHHAGAEGRLILDDFEVNRLSPSLR